MIVIRVFPVVLLMLLNTLWSWAQLPAFQGSDTRALLDEAALMYRKADELESSGQSAAATEALRGALMRYERVGDQTGWINGLLLYNTANTYLRLGDVGHAVLFYRRAAELIPGDRNVRQGLSYARRLRTDQIEHTLSAGISRAVLFWHFLLPTRTRAMAFLAIWFSTWVILFFRFFSGVFRQARWLRYIVVAGALSACIIAVSLTVELLEEEQPAGVITASSVIARQGDGHSYGSSFNSSLHEGTEFRLLQDRGKWWYIRLADGRETWIIASAADLV